MTMRRPTHAYVPGLTPRHPEGAFDDIREGLASSMTEEELAASSAFRHGLIYLEGGFHWEAHEVLEPVWMAARPNSAERYLLQGLIQIANARLKIAMGRPGAALKLCRIAAGLLAEAGQGGASVVMGVSLMELQRQLDRLQSELNDAG